MEKHRLLFTMSPEVATRVYTQEAPEADAGGLAMATFPCGHKRRVLLQIER
jgi:hypothetical protein